MSVLFLNANLIDEEGKITLGTDVLCDNGIIKKIRKDISENADEVLDCTGKFLTPGFAVMHTHSPMNIFKGIAEDCHIDDWFNRDIWPYESKMQEEDIYWGAKLSCAEMINNGITVFADHYFNSHLIARAAKETGIRADIAYTIFGFGGDCTEELGKAVEFFNRFKDDEMIAPRMGPHSPYICTPEVLKTVIDKAKELGCGIHLHVSETKAQVDRSKEAHNGKTPFEVVYDAGGFSLPCIVGHGLWIEEGDLRFISDDTLFANAPKTYHKLGMGKGGVYGLLKKLNVAVGTDGAASSNSVDALEQARILALLGKIEDNAEDYKLEEIWKYLFSGHNYLKFNSGKLHEGYKADLLLFDLDMVNTAPNYNPLAAIIYSANAANITHVMINGIFRKADGKLLFDEKKIIDNAKRCAKAIYERGRGTAQIFF